MRCVSAGFQKLFVLILQLAVTLRDALVQERSLDAFAAGRKQIAVLCPRSHYTGAFDTQSRARRLNHVVQLARRAFRRRIYSISLEATTIWIARIAPPVLPHPITNRQKRKFLQACRIFGGKTGCALGRFSTSEERLPSRGGGCSRRWCLGQLRFRIRQLRLILRRLRNCRFRIGRFGLVARVRRHCILAHEHLPETSSTHSCAIGTGCRGGNRSAP
jgi:hypothetical protein